MNTTSNDPIDFIKLLKSQHKSIISTVYEIDTQAGGPSNLTNSIDKLNKITELLFDHLEKEDKHLYPALVRNKETQEIGKKYFYDMERLSCITIDFFKRYCTNREGLKIFVEDFINSYSLFRGLLKTRIKREEIQLSPLYLLLESGALYSEVLDYLHEHDSKVKDSQKRIFIYSQNQPNLDAIALGLEIAGYEVVSNRSIDNFLSALKSMKSDLILLDTSKSNKELSDLIIQLKTDEAINTPLVAYSQTEDIKLEESIQKKFDHFIAKPAIDVEALSEKIKLILSK